MPRFIEKPAVPRVVQAIQVSEGVTLVFAGPERANTVVNPGEWIVDDGTRLFRMRDQELLARYQPDPGAA